MRRVTIEWETVPPEGELVEAACKQECPDCISNIALVETQPGRFEVTTFHDATCPVLSAEGHDG